MKRIFDGDSFGSNCPKNWEEIADFLNDVLAERSDEDMDDMDLSNLMEEIWEEYCSGRLDGVPEAIMDQE